MLNYLLLNEGCLRYAIGWRGSHRPRRSRTGLVDDVAVDGDAAVGANDGAQGAAGAMVNGIEQDYRPVALAVQLFRQSQNILGTGLATQIASLTPFDINYNSSSCHL
jgi:hypothetical protein